MLRLEILAGDNIYSPYKSASSGFPGEAFLVTELRCLIDFAKIPLSGTEFFGQYRNILYF